MKCCQSFPIGRFREPCVECCALSQNSTLIFRPSYQASFSGVGRGDQQPSGEDEEGRTLGYVTGETRCSNPCTELEPPQPCYLDQATQRGAWLCVVDCFFDEFNLGQIYQYIPVYISIC